MAVEAKEITKIQNVGTDSEGNALKAALLKEVSYANSVLTGTTVGDRTFTYNTTDAEIVGDYSSLTNNMDFENVRVYVVFKLNDDQNQREAVKVYAIDVDDSSDASGNPTDDPTNQTRAYESAAEVDGKTVNVTPTDTTPANVKTAIIAALKTLVDNDSSVDFEISLPNYNIPTNGHGVYTITGVGATAKVGTSTADATVTVEVNY